MTTSSCSTLNRQRFFAATSGMLVGGMIGAVAGKSFSPDKANEAGNALLGASIGVTLGGAAGFGMGSFFWNEDPENKKLPNMILKGVTKNQDQGLNYAPQSKSKTLLSLKDIKKLPISNNKLEIPSFLKGKLKKPNLVIYDIPAFEERKDGGRIIYHEEHKAYEYVLEDQIEPTIGSN